MTAWLSELPVSLLYPLGVWREGMELTVQPGEAVPPEGLVVCTDYCFHRAHLDRVIELPPQHRVVPASHRVTQSGFL